MYVRHGADTVREVLEFAAFGFSKMEISRRVGVNPKTVLRWVAAGPARLERDEPCDGRSCARRSSVDEPAYAYLLGQYLGDGHIVRAQRTYRLEICCCAAYAGIKEECADAISKVFPHNRVGRRTRPGAVNVGCYSNHLPCLFPQHGAGPKHQRRIVLESWQRRIALDNHPAQLVRGLIHSDGWRGTNRVRGSNGSPYAYPRYMFCNHSVDLRALFVEVCDRLGVSTRRMNTYDISVARRESVAILDQLVGPKY